jgi:hypothetical protein
MGDSFLHDLPPIVLRNSHPRGRNSVMPACDKEKQR